MILKETMLYFMTEGNFRMKTQKIVLNFLKC